jgi:hypothetical protein
LGSLEQSSEKVEKFGAKFKLYFLEQLLMHNRTIIKYGFQCGKNTLLPNFIQMLDVL